MTLARKARRAWPALIVVLIATPFNPARTDAQPARGKKERHLLYVAEPGVRNYTKFGGAGILVFDMDNAHKLVRRIDTPASKRKSNFVGHQDVENIKGICACTSTGKLYFTTLTRLYCVDLKTDKTLWEKAPQGGCDRLAITPDGKTLWTPSYEKAHWNVIDAMTGENIKMLYIAPAVGAHNTICSLDGTRAYLASRLGTPSPTEPCPSQFLHVYDCSTLREISKVGPFSNRIRPFTIDGAQKRCYVNCDELLGFEIGDITRGQKLAQVVVKGFEKGKVKRHACPSHGIGLTPDEKEVWICDLHNSRLHVFDNTVMPPKQIASIEVRDQPGWITFSLDGRYAYPSSGEVIDTKAKKILLTLQDELGRDVQSEKVVEIVFVDGVPVRNGDQFGLGRRQ
jgi:hypothetical protein